MREKKKTKPKLNPQNKTLLSPDNYFFAASYGRLNVKEDINDSKPNLETMKLQGKSLN